MDKPVPIEQVPPQTKPGCASPQRRGPAPGVIPRVGAAQSPAHGTRTRAPSRSEHNSAPPQGAAGVLGPEDSEALPLWSDSVPLPAAPAPPARTEHQRLWAPAPQHAAPPPQLPPASAHPPGTRVLTAQGAAAATAVSRPCPESPQAPRGPLAAGRPPPCPRCPCTRPTCAAAAAWTWRIS